MCRRMWAEARKHEKKIRGIVIDLRRRAERRRAHYDAIKEDPVSFLRIHGNKVISAGHFWKQKNHFHPSFAFM